jgi:hypothetical protein
MSDGVRDSIVTGLFLRMRTERNQWRYEAIALRIVCGFLVLVLLAGWV